MLGSARAHAHAGARMPNRQANKLKAQARQRKALECAAASVIQETLRARARDVKKTQEHIEAWQMFRKKPTVFESVVRESLVRFGENTEFEHPRIAQRRIAQSDALEYELRCRICQERATAPMFSSCCPSAAEFGCICFACLHRYLQLDITPAQRRPLTAAWSPSCANTTNCQRIRKKITNEFSAHLSFACIDRLRDACGESECFACGAHFETTAALRRHLAKDCLEIQQQCSKCDFYGKRRLIPAHHRDVHEYVACPCCDEMVALSLWPQHAARHVRDLALPRHTVNDRYIVHADGSVVRRDF